MITLLLTFVHRGIWLLICLAPLASHASQPEVWSFPSKEVLEAPRPDATVSRQLKALPEELGHATSFIVGGNTVSRGEYPEYAMLVVEYDGYLYSICGATLIAPDKVLTAAHCVENFYPWQLYVVLGHYANNDPRAEDFIDVSDTHIHPNYNSYAISHDVAIVDIGVSSNKPKAKVFSGPDKLEGETASVVGMGQLRGGDSGPLPNVLQEVNLPIASNAACAAKWGQGNIDASMLCAGGRQSGGIGSCSGDSGGPLFIDYEGQRVQAGIVSWGHNQCAQPGYYDVYARTSSLISFIRQHSPSTEFVRGGAPNVAPILSLLLDDVSPSAPPEPVAQNSVKFQSMESEKPLWLTSGEVTLNLGNASIEATSSAVATEVITVLVAKSQYPYSRYQLDFSAYPERRIEVGRYTILGKEPSPYSPVVAGIDISSLHSSCSTTRGHFVVHEVGYGTDGIRIEKLALDFSQYCEGSSNPLVGGVRINSMLPQYPETSSDGLPVVSPPDPIDLPPATTILHLDSEPGDYIGQGLRKLFDSNTESFSLGEADELSIVTVRMTGDKHFELSFEGYAGQSLQIGRYSGAIRYPFNSDRSPGLSISGESRGCNRLEGEFYVHELDWDPASREITALAVDFVQYCDGAVGALKGGVRHNSSIPNYPEAGTEHLPVIAPPPLGYTANLTMVSEEGEYIGGGETFELTTNEATFALSKNHGNGVSASIHGNDRWSLDFEGYNGESLQVGKYLGATDYPWNSERKPGINISGQGRGCSNGVGEFYVHELDYDAHSGAISAFAVDFVQYCGTASAALNGSLRYNSDVPNYPEASTDHLPVIPLPLLGYSANLTMVSEEGEYIGGGETFELTTNEAIFALSKIHENGVSVLIEGDNRWWLDFEGYDGESLQVGKYLGATDYPWNSKRKPGINISGQGRGCSNGIGEFYVHELDYDAHSGAISAFAVDFVQYCGTASAALNGGLRYNSDVPNYPEASTDHLPVISQPPLEYTASLVVISETGDYIGLGKTFEITTNDATFEVSKNHGNGVTVQINGDDYWTLDLEAPNGTTIELGKYEGATRFPFQEPGISGLDFSGRGRGCNQLSGEFEVFEIAYGEEGVAEVLDVAFIQHCENGAAALHGRLKYNVD